jgi:hypothetical protein
MIGSELVRQIFRFSEFFHHRRSDESKIDAPAFVINACGAFRVPPRVCTFVAVHVSVSVHETFCEERSQPFSFFGQVAVDGILIRKVKSIVRSSQHEKNLLASKFPWNFFSFKQTLII